MKPRPEQQADQQRGRARRAGAEADVADEVEEAREARAARRSGRACGALSVTRSTSLASPTRVRRLDQHRVAGPAASSSKRRSPRRPSSARSTADLADERFASGAMSSPIRISRSTLRVEHRLGEAGVQRVAMLAELAHRPEHGDAPLDVASPRRGSSSVAAMRRRIGVVAFVDQQALAAVEPRPGGARRGP